MRSGRSETVGSLETGGASELTGALGLCDGGGASGDVDASGDAGALDDTGASVLGAASLLQAAREKTSASNNRTATTVDSFLLFILLDIPFLFNYKCNYSVNSEQWSVVSIRGLLFLKHLYYQRGWHHYSLIDNKSIAEICGGDP